MITIPSERKSLNPLCFGSLGFTLSFGVGGQKQLLVLVFGLKVVSGIWMSERPIGKTCHQVGRLRLAARAIAERLKEDAYSGRLNNRRGRANYP